MKPIIQFSFAVLLTFSSCCDFYYEKPECDIIKVEKEDSTPGSFAKLIITVSNVGNEGDAYDVGCSIKLKKDNIIIETGWAYFGTLREGEAAREESWLSGIETHQDYDTREILLYWYDEDNNSYQKSY